MDDHDEVDKLLAEVFLESLKTGDYTYREQIEFPGKSSLFYSIRLFPAILYLIIAKE